MQETKAFPGGGPIALRNGVWYLCILAGAVAFAVWLRGAPMDQPQFLLRPVAYLTGVLSGVSFVRVPGMGYCGVTYSGVPVRIVNLCSGGNYLVMLYVLLVLTQLRKLETIRRKVSLCVGGLLFCYGCTVVVSALRVAATVLLTGVGLPVGWDLMHNVVGMVTYTTMICVCYLTAERLIGSITKRKAVTNHG